MLAYCSPSLPHNNNPSPDRTALGLSIYYEIQDRGEGSSRFITILHKGGLPNLLQFYKGGFFKVYYNITDLVGIWKGSGHFQYYIYFYVVLKVRIFSQIWKTIANM